MHHCISNTESSFARDDGWLVQGGDSAGIRVENPAWEGVPLRGHQDNALYIGVRGVEKYRSSAPR